MKSTCGHTLSHHIDPDNSRVEVAPSEKGDNLIQKTGRLQTEPRDCPNSTYVDRF